MKKFVFSVVVALLLLAAPGFAQNKAAAQFTLAVNPGVVTITTVTVPNGMAGKSYSVTVIAVGGILPYTFSVSSGTLPAGLALNATTGVISGTPTTAATSAFTVKVSDSESPAIFATQAYSVLIVPTLTITTLGLPAANVGVAYSGTVAATGGVAPYTFAVTTGALPAGLTLNSSTGAITGTPTAAGSFTFTITVTDSATFTASVLGRARIEITAVLRRPDNRS